MAENMPPADFMTATGWSVNDVKNRDINGFKAIPQKNAEAWVSTFFASNESYFHNYFHLDWKPFRPQSRYNFIDGPHGT